jgi:hypothetical protein
MHSGSCLSSLHSDLLDGEVLLLGTEEYSLLLCSTLPESTRHHPGLDLKIHNNKSLDRPGFEG